LLKQLPCNGKYSRSFGRWRWFKWALFNYSHFIQVVSTDAASAVQAHPVLGIIATVLMVLNVRLIYFINWYSSIIFVYFNYKKIEWVINMAYGFSRKIVNNFSSVFFPTIYILYTKPWFLFFCFCCPLKYQHQNKCFQ
jgi:hypothetical protein